MGLGVVKEEHRLQGGVLFCSLQYGANAVLERQVSFTLIFFTSVQAPFKKKQKTQSGFLNLASCCHYL